MTARLRVVVAGTVVGVPNQGGAAWAVLQWAIGAWRLGHEVVVVEELAPNSPSCPDVLGDVVRDAGSALPWVAYRAHDPADRLRRQRASEFVRGADLLINLAGTCRLPEIAAVSRSVFVDLDPGYTQCWHGEGFDFGIARHSHHATVGLALGRPECPVPLLGLCWLPTPPPVDVVAWAPGDDPPRWTLTTVAHWRSYGSVSFDGVSYGQKAHAVRELAALPTRSAIPIELALSIHPDETGDIDMLRSNRWRLVDPIACAARPSDYRHYVSSSAGEFGVTKHGYVASRCGWFSDRSACYLAAGRPIVIPDTGAGDWLAHDGILRFSSLEQAVDVIDDLSFCWSDHARAARRFAETRLDARLVVGRLIEQVMS